MTSGRINTVIGVAVMALLGILFIQGFWIYKSWNTYVKNYEHRIHQAAVHAANRLEKGRVRKILESKRREHLKRMKNRPTGMQYKDVSSEVYVDISDDGTETTTKVIVINGDTLGKHVISRSGGAEGRSRGGVWTSDIQEIALEEYISDSSTMIMIQNLPIDSILKRELEKENVAMTYSYRIFNEEDSSFRKKKGRNRHGKVVVPLFRRTSKDHPLFLQVQVEDQFAKIPGWFIWVVCLSVLFSSAMIWAFWFVVQGLLKQKRISDIKSDFINNMTHEFKTPISTISLAVDSMRMDPVKNDPSQVEYYSDIIKQENKRMDGQVERVLQAAQLDKGQLLIETESVDLRAIVEKVISSFELILEEKNGRIDLTPKQADPVILNGDSHHLYNTVRNLIDNAIKYSEEAPFVQIDLSEVEGQIILSVKDNGIGMTKEEQKHLFKKFFRANQGDLHNAKGFGLGLNYVHYIVDQHRGSIQVKSAKGIGSQFVLKLPK